MQIEKLTVRNMIAARNVDIKLNTPITLICGSNEAGKSSICEGIKHALTGESTRVSLKKDYRHLVNDGSDVGYTYLEFDGGKQACITLPNGTHELKEQLHPALPYVLDPELFSRLSEDDKRRFILSLSSVKNDMQSVKAELLKRGCDASKVEKILPFLRSGFDAGFDQAKTNGKDAKTAWRTVAGEAYGEKKAVEWKAVAPEVDQQSVVDAGRKVTNIDAEIAIENVKLGSAQASFNAHQKNAVEISNLKEMAGKIERIQKKLETDRKEHQSWSEKVEETKRAAMGSAPGNVALKCPECAAELAFNGNSLTKREGDLHDDEEAAVKLPQYEKSLEVLTKSIVNGERDLASAMYAKERLETIDKESVESFSEEGINQIKARIASLKLDLSQAKINLDTLNTSARQAKEAKEKTAKAAEYHADVQAWEVIAEALSPEGIPGQMLSAALDPINKRLAESAVETGWKQVVIYDDMSISYDCRPHGLSSVSAKWRTNAMIAEAISYVSGIRFMLLDGFDVLSLEGRSELIGWLEYLAQKKEVETVIAFGTLKSLPSGLPDCIDRYWLINGVVAELEAA